MQYTPERLLDIAAKALEKYEERAAVFGPGTFDRERNEARDLYDKAMFAAHCMEEAGEASAAGVGSFCDVELFPGDKVRLKKGAKVRTTHPQKKGGYENPRTRNVVVSRFEEGHLNPNAHHRDPSRRDPFVVWVGAGGYWFWADINQFEAD